MTATIADDPTPLYQAAKLINATWRHDPLTVEQINAYATILADLPGDLVHAAVVVLANSTREYAPKPGHIREQAERLAGGRTDPSEAYARFREIVREVPYSEPWRVLAPGDPIPEGPVYCGHLAGDPACPNRHTGDGCPGAAARYHRLDAGMARWVRMCGGWANAAHDRDYDHGATVAQFRDCYLQAADATVETRLLTESRWRAELGPSRTRAAVGPGGAR